MNPIVSTPIPARSAATATGATGSTGSALAPAAGRLTRRGLFAGTAALAGTALASRAAVAHAADSDDSGVATASGSSWRVDDVWQADGRLYQVRLVTDDLPWPFDMFVLVPTSYDDATSRHYPVLYLLHGSGEDHAAWFRATSVEWFTRGAEMIVVLPDGGHGGFYLNHQDSDLGAVNWATVHLEQMIDAIDTHFRTLAQREARAVAGCSMGGYGALHYAALRPDLFAAASSYSGALDISTDEFRSEMYWLPCDDGENAGAIWGTSPGDEDPDALAAHNPVQLADRLTETSVALYAGTAQDYEELMLDTTRTMRDALQAAGVDPVYVEQPDAGHTWQTWNDALRSDLPHLLEVLAPAVDQ